ncbi:hypothetical protein BC940DRAFT_322968 [Gongronella butleri]|nr:hypothetical protein BC940DRAFT_322968 [Gongronella butleri]
MAHCGKLCLSFTVVVSKLMEKGHATADELVFSTGLARPNVDAALRTLFKHGLCITASTAQEQADESPVSYSFDMNATMTRPCKTAVVMITRLKWGENGAAIANAIFVNGRMTMTSLVNEGLDTKVALDMAKNRCLSLVLTRSPFEVPESRLDWMKDEWQRLLESGKLGRFELNHPMTIKKVASFVVDCELKRLISQGFVIATTNQDDHLRLYRADLSQLTAKMKEHSLLEVVRATCDEPTRQIAAVLLNGDVKTLEEIHEVTHLPKTDIWSKLLTAETMDIVKSDIPIQDSAFDPDDKRQWRIHTMSLQAAALKRMYDTLTRLNEPIPSLGTDEARTIIYNYGMSLILRNI